MTSINLTPDDSWPPVGQRLPPQWQISPAAVLAGDQAAAAQCPSQTDTLTTFAIVNAIELVVKILCGLGPTSVFYIARKHYRRSHGIPDPSGRKRYQILRAWFPILAGAILSNLFNGVMIHNTAGYENVDPINALLLYTIRPRIEVPLYFLLTACVYINGEYPYMGALLGHAVAQLLLLIIALTQAAIISHGGSMGRFGNPVLLLAFALASYVVAFLCIVFVSWPQDASGGNIEGKIYKGVPIRNSCMNRFLWSVLILVFWGPGYILQWLFYAALVTYAQEEWCPPKLPAQAAVWICLGVVGTWLGTGL